MSGQRENTRMEKEKGDSKSVLSKANDRVKYTKKNEKRSPSERGRDEATSSNNYSSPKSSSHNFNISKRNIAQNRLKKLRTKLDTEMKLKDRVESVGISRLLDESVVKVEKSRALPNKQKLPKIPRIESHAVSRPVRNIASDRLKKVKKEVQTIAESKNVQTFVETIKNVPTLVSATSYSDSVPTLKSATLYSDSVPTLESATLYSNSVPTLEEDDSLMEIDEDIGEPTEKAFPNEINTLQNLKENPFTGSISLSRNNSHFDGFPFETSLPKLAQEASFNQSQNSTNNNDSSFDVNLFINDEISKIRQDPTYMAAHLSIARDIEMEVDTPDGDLLIVIDTNVFLSHLNILSYLLKNPPKGSLNSCVLVVPWPVIQEIDYAMKKNDDILTRKARFANNFINECLKKKHPRFFGQSLVDFKENFKNAVNVDDFILQYCMRFVSIDKKVILLTNDRNLSSKAMINNLTVFSTSEFANQFDLSEFVS